MTFSARTGLTRAAMTPIRQWHIAGHLLYRAAASGGAIGGSASEAVCLQERPLFVVHLLGELPKPVEATRHSCQRLAWR